MQVVKEEFEEAGEKDADGHYDYYYAGVKYRFVFPEWEFVGKRYRDTFGLASIVGRTRRSDKQRLPFEDIPYDDPQFREVALYLRDAEGVDFVEVLVRRGYLPLDYSRLDEEPRDPDDFHCFQCHSLIKRGEDKCSVCGWSWK